MYIRPSVIIYVHERNIKYLIKIINTGIIFIVLVQFTCKCSGVSLDCIIFVRTLFACQRILRHRTSMAYYLIFIYGPIVFKIYALIIGVRSCFLGEDATTNGQSTIRGHWSNTLTWETHTYHQSYNSLAGSYVLIIKI